MRTPEDVFVSGAGKKIFQRGLIGTQWQSIAVNTPLDPFFNADAITGVQRLNDTIMVAILGSLLEVEEFVLRSIDGGTNWQVVHNGPDLTGFNDLAYLPSDRCIAVGNGGRIVVGTDLGETWDPVFIPTQASLRSIAMWNGTSGFVGGHGVLLRTTTSGVAWTVVYEGPESFQRIAAWGPDTLYATARDGLGEFDPMIFMRSFDGGASWEHVDTPFSVGSGIAATSDTTVYMATALGMHRSISSGNEWYSFPDATVLPAIKDIDFHDPMNGVAVGHNNVLQLTDNGGGPGSPVAFFTSDTLRVCPGGSIAFTNRSPIGFTYQWSIGNTPVSSDYDVELAFDTPGSFTVSLAVNAGSTEVSYSRTVQVIYPPSIPYFMVNLNGGPVCQGSSRSIGATYTGGVPNAFRFKVDGIWVTDWITTSQVNYQITDVQQDLPIEIERRVVGTCGPVYASAFDTLRMVPAPPPIEYMVASDSICMNNAASVTLSGLDPNYDYRSIWSYLNGTTVGMDVFADTTGPVVADHHIYGDTTFVTRSFTVIGQFQGCSFTVVPPQLIWAFPVRAEFEANPPHAMTGEPVTFVNNSIGSQFNWTFPPSAQPQTSILPEPQVIFTQTSFEETVELIVTNVAGCTDRDTVNVEVMAPIQTIAPAECIEQVIGEPMVWVAPEGYSMGLGYYYSPLDMVTDPSGNSIVTGCYRNSQGDYYGDALFVTKYDRSGEVVWDRRAPQQSSNHSSTGVALDIDLKGNILLAGLAGAYNNTWSFAFLGMNFGYSASSAGFIVKLDSAGQAVWSINVTGGDDFEGVTDVLFLPDGGAVFAMNGSYGEREILFTNGETLSTHQFTPQFGDGNLFLVRVNEFGEFVAILSGSAPVGQGSSFSFGPVFSPIATFTNFTGYSPLSPRLSLSCDGSIQVYSYQYGRHDLDGTLYGEPYVYYHALSSTEVDLSNWRSHHLFATQTCSEGRDILNRPVLLSGTKRNTTLLAISDRQMNSPHCDTTHMLSNGTFIDAHGQSVVFLIDHQTGEILWDRELGGVGIKELVQMGDDHLVVFGQALEHASVMIDGEVMGQNDLQLRDVVLFEFDFDGNFYGMTSFSSAAQDIACEATSNGCDEITMLVSLEGEARLLRTSMNGTCSTNLCTELDLALCNDTLAICFPQPVALSWQFSGPLTPLSIIRSDDQIPSGVVLSTSIDPAAGYFIWSPDIEMYDGSSFDLSVIDQFNDTLGTATIVLNPPISADLEAAINLACSPDSIALFAAPGFASYQWSHVNSDTSMVHVHQSGTYSVTVMDSIGCLATGSVDVSFLPGDLFNANDTVICGVATGILNVPAGFDGYTWSTGYEGPLAQQPVTESGTVIVTATSSACVLTDSILVELIPPISISVPDQSFCIGSLLQVMIIPDIPVTYSWAIGGSASTHIILPDVYLYSLTVTDEGGCTYTAPIIIQPVSCVGIDEPGSLVDLLLKPNPASTSIHITHNASMRWLNVFDPAGRKLISLAIPLGTNSTPVDIADLASGSYVIEVISDAGERIRKVFVKD